MNDYKLLAENILSDLMNNKSISEILLKLKIFASKKGDEDLLKWVSKELNGYGEEVPPIYRILNAGLKIKVFVGFGVERWIEFPSELINENKIRERLSHLPFHQSVGEIEGLCSENKQDGDIMIHVPVYVYSFISEFVNGEIQDAYQYTTKAAVSQIITQVKSILVDYLLKISDEEDINFNTFITNNSNMNNNITINAGFVNTGNGSINATGATNVVGDNNKVCANDINELLRIISEIDKIAAVAQPNQDYEEASKDIKEELKKDKPEKKFLKRCFQLLPSFLSNVSASVLANELNPLVASALSLL